MRGGNKENQNSYNSNEEVGKRTNEIYIAEDQDLVKETNIPNYICQISQLEHDESRNEPQEIETVIINDSKDFERSYNQGSPRESYQDINLESKMNPWNDQSDDEADLLRYDTHEDEKYQDPGQFLQSYQYPDQESEKGQQQKDEQNDVKDDNQNIEFQNILFSEENNDEITKSPTFRQQLRESELSSRVKTSSIKQNTYPLIPVKQVENRCQSYSPVPPSRSYSPLNISGLERAKANQQSPNPNLSAPMSASQASGTFSPTYEKMHANHSKSYNQANFSTFEGILLEKLIVIQE